MTGFIGLTDLEGVNFSPARDGNDQAIIHWTALSGDPSGQLAGIAEYLERMGIHHTLHMSDIADTGQKFPVAIEVFHDLNDLAETHKATIISPSQ